MWQQRISDAVLKFNLTVWLDTIGFEANQPFKMKSLRGILGSPSNESIYLLVNMKWNANMTSESFSALTEAALQTFPQQLLQMSHCTGGLWCNAAASGGVHTLQAGSISFFLCDLRRSVCSSQAADGSVVSLDWLSSLQYEWLQSVTEMLMCREEKSLLTAQNGQNTKKRFKTNQNSLHG